MEAKLIEGSGGVFEVRLGEELLFSKKKEGRFPEPAEILQSLRSRARS